MNSLSKTKIILYLIAIFAAGGVTGATVAVKATKQMMAETPRTGRMEARYLKEKFQSKLNLTPEQSKVIDPLLDKMSEDLKSIRAETSRRIGMVMKSSYEQIGKELTAEQRVQLETMKKDHSDSTHRRSKLFPDSSRRSNAPPQMP